MSGIECAFFGTLGRDAEPKTAKTSGRPYVRLNVRVGEGDAAQWVNCLSFDTEAIAAVDRLVQGARIYCEGALTLNKWTDQAGVELHGLSVLSWHTRLAAIGRNKPRKQTKDNATGDTSVPPANSFYSDEIPL